MKMESINEKEVCHAYNTINLETGKAYFYKDFEPVCLPHYAKLIIN